MIKYGLVQIFTVNNSEMVNDIIFKIKIFANKEAIM